jgi:hypothetical protein
MSIAAILAEAGLLVRLGARSRHALRSGEASIGRVDARLGIMEAGFAALDAKRNSGDHVPIGHPHLIEMREEKQIRPRSLSMIEAG